ncbi:DUF2272 domain-containing protein [Roseibium sp.]|uniref:DUF2272 domain-containing protein n=1 Tax=Roseibium sp. TaxID=1936156 RepID=UPI003D0BA39B
MPVMITTRTLRDAPFGKTKNIQAEGGTPVKILDDTSSSAWINIELLHTGLSPNPTGWVSRKSVDPNSDVLGPLNKSLFAMECVVSAKTFGISAHYMMAVAQMRTNVTDGPSGTQRHGPFGFTDAEWEAFRRNHEFNIDFSSASRASWIAQCWVFASRTHVVQSKLADLLGNQPQAVQLALAHMIGATAATLCIRSTNALVTDVLSTVDVSDLQSEGLDSALPITDFANLLGGKTGHQAIEATAKALQTSLDEVSDFIKTSDANLIKFAQEHLQKSDSQSDYTSATEIAGKQIRYEAPDGSILLKKGGSVSWRYNNPGNITKSTFANNNGAIGNGTKFAIFPYEDVGYKALQTLLSGNSYRNLSLLEAMRRYAPEADNNQPHQYADFLSNLTGISLAQVIGTVSPDKFEALCQGIKRFEGWKIGTEEFTPGTTVVSHPRTVDAIVRSATREWEHWGKSTWNTITNTKNIGQTERSPGYAEYVYDNYYKAAVKDPNPANRQHMIKRIKEASGVSLYAWSAVGLSGIFHKAGIPFDALPFAQSHSVYIRASVKARNDPQTSTMYAGYVIDEVAPEVGDIVGYARGTSGQFSLQDARNWYKKTGAYKSHADIVVAKRAGEIDVIGANVLDSVTKKTLRTDPLTGKLIDTSHAWFVVMKRRLPN